MTVGVHFPGDSNETLKWIQHGLYPELVPYLFRCSRDRYVRAAHLLQAQTDLFRVITTFHSFDHRVLQAAHDTIAASYRFAVDPRGQLPLLLDGVTYEHYLENLWRDYYLDEVARLAEDDAVARAILSAVAYQNSEHGYAAEDELSRLLQERYGDLRSP
jgi:hypothetical protein